MTLPTSGTIGFTNVDAEIGVAARTPMSLAWVRSNSYYAYKNLGSIYGLTWFNSTSSQNVVARSVDATVTNCANAVATIQGNPSAFKGAGPTKILTNCTKRITTNCDQCGYSHGTFLQKNCNCNCNCGACNCNYSACNCYVPPPVTCSTCSTCTCSSSNTCTCACTCTCNCTCATCSTAGNGASSQCG